jgi:hypothetical protein
MPETIEEYRQRLAGYVEGKDPLTIQRQTAAQLAELIGGVSKQQLTSRPAPEKWSIVEIIAHLAEDEMATSWRYRQMIEHEGTRLSGFDQDLWAHLGKYQTWSAIEALELFRLLREANLRMLASLSPEQWEHSAEHAERGRLNVANLARHMAGHDINHIRQVEALLQELQPQDEQAQQQNVRPSFVEKANAAFSPRLTLQEVAEQLRRMPVVLRELISALPHRAVAYHPGPRKWCIKEVMGHLTEEDKRDFVGRIEAMLHESEPRLKLNDQDEVARERHDCDKNIDELLDEFTTIRTASIGFVKQLSAADLERRGIHPKIGFIRIRELLHEWVYHDLNHLRQIEGNAQSFLWNHLGNMRGFYTS